MSSKTGVCQWAGSCFFSQKKYKSLLISLYALVEFTDDKILENAPYNKFVDRYSCSSCTRFNKPDKCILDKSYSDVYLIVQKDIFCFFTKLHFKLV